jgi:1-aminocyclopropane-1-carboxylate deaminase
MSNPIDSYFSQKAGLVIQEIPNKLLFNDIEGNFENIEVSILREDRMFPELQGNKFRKLKYHLKNLPKGASILSVAGPYSNHLHALAVATKLFGLKTKVIIRKGTITQTPTTIFAMNSGVELFFISPLEFRKRYSIEQQNRWLIDFKADYFIPEGGGGPKGVSACEEILANPDLDVSLFTHVFCAAGSGTMLAGIAKSIIDNSYECTLVGVSAVKQTQHLEDILMEYAPSLVKNNQVHLIGDLDFKGFGRWDNRLLTTIKKFDAIDVELEQIYTAKMIWYLKNYFVQESAGALGSHKYKVLCIHSGGLQGRCGLISTIV